MSGFVGIVNRDGKPVDPGLLARMTACLAYRGPDGHHSRVAGNVGFGHALLRTTFEAANENQPFSFDGKTWIVADCRVDAREELVAKLLASGRRASLDRPDVELILHAWHVWREKTPEHLLGDFAFAVWDDSERCLFCARDHMGIKPFYFAEIGRTLIFSNTLDCLLWYPGLSRRHNEIWIADFLVFGHSQEKDTTVYRDIVQLSPSEARLFTSSGARSWTYWILPVEEPLYLRDSTEYTHRFRALLSSSVRDRLRSTNIGVMMSGGLDSPALAQTACDLYRAEATDRSPIQAFTSVYDTLIDDDERHFAQLVADELDIPIHYDVKDSDISILDWGQIKVDTPEPVVNPMAAAANLRYYRRLGRTARVFLYGEGPDNALTYDWRPYLSYLIQRGRWSRILEDIHNHLQAHRRIPLIPSIPAILLSRLAPVKWTHRFPPWLRPDFVDRLRLQDRWRASTSHDAVPLNPRFGSWRSLGAAVWQLHFGACDYFGGFGQLEVRHPYLDIRLLKFMLQVPPIPWCRKKHIIREAMRSRLPSKVLRRPKSPLMQDPEYERLKSMEKFENPFLKEVSPFVDVDSLRFPRDPFEFRLTMRPHALSYWLANSRRAPS